MGSASRLRPARGISTARYISPDMDEADAYFPPGPHHCPTPRIFERTASPHCVFTARPISCVMTFDELRLPDIIVLVNVPRCRPGARTEHALQISEFENSRDEYGAWIIPTSSGVPIPEIRKSRPETEGPLAR
jgi:hypothetical protein